MADREEFQKKLAELLAKAAAQGNRMTQEELAAFFRDENLTEEQMELVVEFLIDVLKLASLNTPDTLSNSFSMLGALILGDFAVQAGWLGPEVLVYMAFVSVAGFAQPSYELGYAFKLLRVALLLLTAAFDVWGFCLGFVGILVLLATTKPLVGHGYLYPLIPFNGKALRRLLVREPINRDNT